MYNIQDHWVSGLIHHQYFKEQKKIMFQKEDLFPSSGEGWKIPSLAGPLQRANLNH
jgi:hypothetical protein